MLNIDEEHVNVHLEQGFNSNGDNIKMVFPNTITGESTPIQQALVIEENENTFEEEHMTLESDSQVNKSMISDIDDFNLLVNGSLAGSKNELEYLKQQIKQISETITSI